MLRRPRTDTRRRIILGPGPATRQLPKSPGKKRTSQQNNGCEHNDWDDSSSTWEQYPAEEPDDWEEEADMETYLTGTTVIC